MDAQCSICLDTVRTSGDSLSLDCGHRYHVFCINKWKENNESCPLCRHDLRVSDDLFGIQNISDEDFSRLRRFFGV